MAESTAPSSPAPEGSGEPEPEKPAAPKDTGKQADDAATSDQAEGIVPAGRTTTDVVPLDSGAVPVDDDARHGLAVELSAIEPTEAAASMPGEIAGSAVRVEVSVKNSGKANHDLSASVVNLYYGPDRTPASSLSGSGETNLPDSVPAGGTASGAYAFAVPQDQMNRVLVEIDVDPTLHVALFEGEVRP
ncbi:hypothetical protein GCM10028784_09030 [Myceligenerans cantabricum]